MADQNLNIGIKVTADTSGAKEAINANGMYLDSLGRIHDATGKFVKVSKEEREGLKERIKLQEQEVAVVSRATVTANGATEAKKRLTQAEKDAAKSSTQTAMGFMALSNAIQDVQFGFGGLINNIPGIVTGMGLGMGVAGAAQIAGVAIGALAKNFDIFGTEAKAAAKDATETANEATALAASTQRVADATANATEKQKEFSNALKETVENFKAVAKASDTAIEQARRLQDIETKRADLQSDLALAEVDVQLASGQISSEDANAKRAGIRAQRDAKAAALAEKTLAETQKAEEERAKAAEDAAKAQKEILRTKLTDQRAAGLLSAEDRKIELGRLDAAEKEAEAATKRMEADKADQEKVDFLRKAAEAAGDKMYVTDEEIARIQRIEIEKNTAQNQYNIAQASRGVLAGDAAARFRTGAKSLEDFNEKRGLAEKGVVESTKIAEEARKRAGIAGEDLGLAREATATRAKIAAMRQSGAAAAAGQSGYGIGFVGPVPPQGFAVDQKEAEKAAKEADSANRSNTASTIKIIRALANELKLTKEQLSALNGVVEDIRTTK